MDRDFYRALYEAEWGRREQLGASLGTPLTVLTIVGAAFGWCYQNARVPSNGLDWLPSAGLGLALVFFLRAVYILARSYHGYTYRQIPSASQIRAFQVELADPAHRAVTTEACSTQFDLQLIERYVEAADRNRANNDSRSDLLYRANAALLICAVLVAISALPILYSLKQQADPVYKVDILRIPGD